ncbi:hypothetical protein OROHE_026707 [Orobanche hederae]
MKKGLCSIKLVLWLTYPLFIFLVFHVQLGRISYPDFASVWKLGGIINSSSIPPIPNLTYEDKLKASVTFLPLKDIRFASTPSQGNTWFMSSLNDTIEPGEPEHLYFPSESSQGRILCFQGRSTMDGTKNSYALAWRDSLPDSAILLEGLTFVSETYYNHVNLWHGICAAVPFVRWSMKNGCLRPSRWVLFHQTEFRFEMGSWLDQLMKVYFGNSNVERFDHGDLRPYCFEKAVVMRHDAGSIGFENRLKVYDSLRCKARNFCGVQKTGRRRNIDGKVAPVITMTFLDRRGTRSFKNATAVAEIFAKECAKVQGCILNVVNSEDLSFCDQVRVMSNTDVVASPHGAQLANMFFMDRNSSVMEFFPKGWLEYAGNGQYCFHWLADQTGMKHPGAWWDSIGEGEDCPNPKDPLSCFLYYHKDGKVGHNATYFAEWTRKVLNEVRHAKLLQQQEEDYYQEKLNREDACVIC